MSQDTIQKVIADMRRAVQANMSPSHKWESAVTNWANELEALASAQASTAAGQVPDGWQLVPVEPTRRMTDAMECAESPPDCGNHQFHRANWQAGLAAAPQPPAAVYVSTAVAHGNFPVTLAVKPKIPAFEKGWVENMAKMEAGSDITVGGGKACSKPPAGWYCSRGEGHEGPCAAREVAQPPATASRDELSREQLFAIREAHEIDAAASYWEARQHHQIDSAKAFSDGFKRGFDAANRSQQ